MQSQTAQESGKVEGSIFTKLSSLVVGQEIDLISIPEFTTHEEYGEQASITAVITDAKGEREFTLQTNNAKTVGSLKSENPKALGGILAAHLEDGYGLTVFVREEEANTGRKQKVLSIF